MNQHHEGWKLLLRSQSRRRIESTLHTIACYSVLSVDTPGWEGQKTSSKCFESDMMDSIVMYLFRSIFVYFFNLAGLCNNKLKPAITEAYRHINGKPLNRKGKHTPCRQFSVGHGNERYRHLMYYVLQNRSSGSSRQAFCTKSMIETASPPTIFQHTVLPDDVQARLDIMRVVKRG